MTGGDGDISKFNMIKHTDKYKHNYIVRKTVVEIRTLPL